MYAAHSNLLVEVGSNLPRPWALKSGTAAFPLVGYHARLQIRSSVDAAGAPLLEATDGAGLVIDESAGTVTLTITPTQSKALDLSALPVGPLQVRKSAAGVPVVVTGPLAVYALELTPPGGAAFRLLQGQVVFSKEVVRV